MKKKKKVIKQSLKQRGNKTNMRMVMSLNWCNKKMGDKNGEFSGKLLWLSSSFSLNICTHASSLKQHSSIKPSFLLLSNSIFWFYFHMQSLSAYSTYLLLIYPKNVWKVPPKIEKDRKTRWGKMLLMCRLWVSEANHPLQRYSAHLKELKFLMESQTFPIPFLWSLSLFFCSSLCDQHGRKHEVLHTAVILFPKCLKVNFFKDILVRLQTFWYTILLL